MDIDALLLKATILNSTLAVQRATAFDQNTAGFYPVYDRFIRRLKLKSRQFDFVGQLATGHVLLVGEGNLSFARSLTGMKCIDIRKLTASTFESEKDLSRLAKSNAGKLRSLGAKVLHGIDARKLKETFGKTRFDSIVFLFPNVASRKPVRGRNPNFGLVRDFLASAASQLASGGRVMMAAVNSPYYLGSFNFTEAARKTGYGPPEIYPFDPPVFVGYEHVMTHQDESALDDHDEFSLWVFHLK